MCVKLTSSLYLRFLLTTKARSACNCVYIVYSITANVFLPSHPTFWLQPTTHPETRARQVSSRHYSCTVTVLIMWVPLCVTNTIFRRGVQGDSTREFPRFGNPFPCSGRGPGYEANGLGTRLYVYSYVLGAAYNNTRLDFSTVNFKLVVHKNAILKCELTNRIRQTRQFC